MSNKLDELIENEVSVDLEKRKFMGKFGKYAVVGVGMATLMTPTLSTAGNYCKPTRRSQRNNVRRGTPDQNSVHTTTINHGGNNHRDRNGH